ncbi:MAG: AAA family ATPase [bacterium]|nr:AAA family ATPase [bacterium]
MLFTRRIEKELHDWQNRKTRKPLLIKGARQVGKTSVILKFAEEKFTQLVYLDLDNIETSSLFGKVTSLGEFEELVELKLKQKLNNGNTLVFIDEVQNCPNLIQLLRAFYEQRPGLHVIAAGSLLEVFIQRQGFQMPVGRVEYMYMYPLDFFEFLAAKGESKLLQILKSTSGQGNISSIHQVAISEFETYIKVGGMPEAVKAFVSNGGFGAETDRVYSSLLSSFAEDVFKYSDNVDPRILQLIINQADNYAGSLFKYENFGNSQYKGRDVSEAIQLLEQALILRQVQAVSSARMPLQAKPRRAKKLLMLDVGLVSYKSGIQLDKMNKNDLHSAYTGRILEQAVGQGITALSSLTQNSLYYWAREKPAGSAEVDFAFTYNGKVIGIEVKAGIVSKLRSIHSLAESNSQAKLVRVYSGKFQKQTFSVNSKTHELLSIPFYLIPRLLELI